MKKPTVITRELFLSDRHGKTFSDVLNGEGAPFDAVIEFFSDPERQQRMEDSEIHHDRAPLAGVVRELEAEPAVHQFFVSGQRRRSARFRQAIGVLVRLIMERRGWKTTGKKGSLGVRIRQSSQALHNNSGGLSLWFIRAERYQLEGGMPYRSVRERGEEIGLPASTNPAVAGPGQEEQGGPPPSSQFAS